MAKEYTEHDLKLQAQAVSLLMAAFGGEDEETKDIIIEGETSFKEAVVSILKSLEDDQILIDGIKNRKDELSLREGRIKARVDRKRAALELAFQAAEIKGSLETALGTVTLKKGSPKLNVNDESKVPSKFWVRPDPVIDRKALLDAIKAYSAAFKALIDEGMPDKAAELEDPAPGASLSNGAPSIQIRRK